MVCAFNRKEKIKMNDAELKVKTIIAKHYGVSIDEIKDTSSFVGDLGGDSLDIIEMVLALEDKYGIVIPEEAAEEMDTVQKVYNYINSLSKESSNDTIWSN